MKRLVFLITVLAFVSCQSTTKKENNSEQATEPVEVVEATVNIGGLHCNNCVASVEKGISELDGIAFIKVTLEDSTAVVKYESAKIDIDAIETAIKKRGYTIKE